MLTFLVNLALLKTAVIEPMDNTAASELDGSDKSLVSSSDLEQSECYNIKQHLYTHVANATLFLYLH